jgi:peptidoglycan endopeptidase LytE
VEQLRQANGLAADNLEIGQKLVIPSSNDGSSQPNKLAKVLPNNLNYREGPSLTSKIISVLHKDTIVEVIEQGETWSKVKVGETTGYLATDYILTNQGSASRGFNAVMNRVKEITASLVGVPYRYGGTSPKGFDCSGFTSYIMNQFGIKLPRVSADQFSVGTKVERKDLQVGDLVFFDTMKQGKISHVGIYIGNNKMVHSATRQVEVNDLNYYFSNYKYYGAKRVIQ